MVPDFMDILYVLFRLAYETKTLEINLNAFAAEPVNNC